MSRSSAIRDRRSVSSAAERIEFSNSWVVRERRSASSSRRKSGERSPELVARVGDEAALALEPVLEPREHLVECAAEPRDLVVRRRDGQSLVE